ncbi:beta-ketoacyl-ACP synthase II [Desulforhabdus amnigena]|jgi:3-oxoacyl-[acyl-carrier-protein] synthase II|uniref:3-oxoacyl-[acyl-carrier-protein] synthase 2 n=1 Tax=Desulforhabdus amnigena TaxID=40218 RepID=A0A9W6CV86_9BACT|nr:beta-ketoacyl-ACP synthase II [Desulforhabdus amnigena]NLJ28833.1 beta-ketoacyl-ACP synthase II [Deltaproteobacteria bacterium]GLI33149.1 3-oxoacyl-[acyl-carrier-protein] synthase 2 [Desulforhabdus amnigena]
MEPNSRRRVVITGVGLVSPLGIGNEENWSSLMAGKSGIGPITRFDTTGFATRIAAEVKDYHPEEFIPKKELRKMDPFLRLALGASRLAFDDSKLKIPPDRAHRAGVFMGCGLGGLTTIEDYHKILMESGPKKVSPFFIPMLIGNMAPGLISIYHGAKGPNLAVQTACAAGTHAVGQAFHMVRDGMADIMITGGVESVVTPLCVAGFNAMRALSTRNDAPEKASRPFERDRDGFVLGEGAAVVILEEMNMALERGAKIYGEIIGFGASGDAYHMAAPAPEGEGAARCMQMALDDAGIKAEEVQYINAHGTSTDLNDKYETQAIKTVFGEHARKLGVSSTKSMTGHLLGAAGGVEAAFTALTLERQVMPPTINYENPDPDCDLDYVANHPREALIDVALSNSFGFGGTNGTLVFRRWTDK